MKRMQHGQCVKREACRNPSDVAWCKIMLNKFSMSELKAQYKKDELHEHEYEMICQVFCEVQNG